MLHALSSQPAALSPSRYRDVSRVLIRVLFLNVSVAIAKIAFGYASGAISILSDGFHSLTDTASNVVGLVGVHAAEQPPMWHQACSSIRRHRRPVSDT